MLDCLVNYTHQSKLNACQVHKLKAFFSPDIIRVLTLDIYQTTQDYYINLTIVDGTPYTKDRQVEEWIRQGTFKNRVSIAFVNNRLTYSTQRKDFLDTSTVCLNSRI